MFDLESTVMSDEGWEPQRIIVSGVQGLGKGTFAATFEKPFLLRTEDGAGNIHVPTFPKVAEDFSEIESGIEALHGEHEYKTLILDSLDWLEPIIWDRLKETEPLSEKGKKIHDIEDYGFGKGYKKCLVWWRHIMGGLDSLRLTKGMNIIIISHTEVKRHEPPESEPYDRYQIKLYKSAASLWQEWADVVLFCNFKTSVQKADLGFGKEKARGTGSGERVIYTEERPSFLAKNRWGLPPDIHIGKDKTWAAFHAALSVSTQGRYQVPTTKGENADE